MNDRFPEAKGWVGGGGVRCRTCRNINTKSKSVCQNWWQGRSRFIAEVSLNWTIRSRFGDLIQSGP